MLALSAVMPNCAWADQDHPGDGRWCLWTRSVRGRLRARELAAAEVDKVRAELAGMGVRGAV